MKKMDWQYIKQCAICLTGAMLFLKGALGAGHYCGYAEGKHYQMQATSMALDNVYGHDEAAKIRHDVNAEFDKHFNY